MESLVECKSTLVESCVRYLKLTLVDSAFLENNHLKNEDLLLNILELSCTNLAVRLTGMTPVFQDV